VTGSPAHSPKNGIAHGVAPTLSPVRLAAWCTYDWGNSAFPALILSYAFAPYFTEHVAPDTLTGTALWGKAMTWSAVAIAVLSPVAGALCDKAGARKGWLAACSTLAILAIALLWLVEPTPRDIALALFLVALANVGFELAYVFYNAMLPDLVPASLVGRASGWGWGVGYMGSLASMVVAWWLLIREHAVVSLDREQLEHLRATAPFAAAWFAVFIVPLFLFVPDQPSSGLAIGRVIRDGLREVAGTLKTLRRYPQVAWYLLAHMIYMDGLNTLFIFGPIYAAGTFGMDESEIVIFGIGMFLFGGIGSAAFAWVDDWLGSRLVVAMSLVALSILCTAALLAGDKETFRWLAFSLALFLGPAQSASRSLMARLAPEGMHNQMFGLYSLAGRATAALGPLFVAWGTVAAGTQRGGMAVIVILLALGLAVLLKVHEPAPLRRDAMQG
jgi:UMF1 family MFS transporter